jgi:hypothetical protein
LASLGICCTRIPDTFGRPGQKRTEKQRKAKKKDSRCQEYEIAACIRYTINHFFDFFLLLGSKDRKIINKR